MPRKSVQHKSESPTERVWSVGEGHRLMHQRNPNNLMLRSAKSEANGDFDGAINAIESAIKKNPKSVALPSYLDDLLRRRRTHEVTSSKNGQFQKESVPTVT